MLAGTLDRAAVGALWPQLATVLAGVHTLDLRAIEQIDSAGLALLAELSARLRGSTAQPPALLGSPPGLAELTAAYRLTPQLDFQATLPSAVN